MTAATHTLTGASADAIRAALWSTEHIPFEVHVEPDGAIDLWPVGRELTTLEEVTVLRAYMGAGDMRVRWYPVVAL